MSKLLKGVIVVLTILGVVACGVKTNDIQVETYTSKKANINEYKTYQIVEGSGIVHDAEGVWYSDKLNACEEMRQMVDAELAKKGKIPVTKNPDFYVQYLARVNMEALEVKLNKEQKEIFENIPKGTIMLLLIDAKKDAIIWISHAEGELLDLPADQMKKRLNYAVKEMFSGM